jgi:O-methyltransferase domain/Dimerisation domain
MAELDTAQASAAAKLLELIFIQRISQAIHVAAALGIADLIADEPKSAEQLAQATGVQAASLRRVMRTLAGFGVFAEEGADRFALTPIGEFLKAGVLGSLRPAALFFGGEDAAQAEGLLLHCVKTGETAYEKLYGKSDALFERFQKDPVAAELFNATMTGFSTLHLTGVLDAYDFSTIKKLVDVGGGHGRNIAEILKRHPKMRGVLFDMPHAFEGGKKTIAQAGLSDRCEVVSGDFFKAVPNGADAYLLSRVIHDWDDQTSIAILKVVRNAIAPDGRLLLLETMLRPGQRSLYPLLSDLNMMLRTGGCERTEEEYRTIYRAAGFELTRTVETISPTGATIVEGRPI